MAITDSIKKAIQSSIDDILEKAEVNLVEVDRPRTDEIGRKSHLTDPFYEQVSHQSVYKPKFTRLSNKMLKEVSIRDWLVSTIIQNRCDSLLLYTRPSKSKHERGYGFKRRDQRSLTPEDIQKISFFEKIIYNCGHVEGTPKSDRFTFGEFCKMTVRDALTFGHIAIEKVLTVSGQIHRFRPIPGEQVYLVDPNATKSQIENTIKGGIRRYQKITDNNERIDEQFNIANIDKYKYVQVGFDGIPIEVFGDEDMIFKLFNPQNFADSLGYCASLTELAIVTVTNHLNVESYNSKFFTNGYAARGVLHLKGMVQQSALAAFRRQFHNSISGSQNAWRTPIVAGLDDVQWVPISANSREMEYIQYNDHILRTVCAQFQIDPAEIGLEYLGHASGKSPMQQASNEYKIEQSKERGFRPILMFYEDLINNEILPIFDAEFARDFQFFFSGYDDSTPMTEVTLLQAEMSVHSSMNDLLRKSGKAEVDEPAAKLPMNNSFWSLVEKNYTRGEIREKFFGDIGASQRKELAYIPGDPMFIQWQNILIQLAGQREQEKQSYEQQAREQIAAQQQQMQDQMANMNAQDAMLQEQAAQDDQAEEEKRAKADAALNDFIERRRQK
jgi:hypothetical protein